MLRDIQLIGLDLDDTTFNKQKQITPRVQRAIIEATRAGIAVLPATGRQLNGLPAAFVDIPGVRYALCANGAKVYDLSTGQVLYEDCFPLETALSVLDNLLQYRTTISAFVDGRCYADREAFDTMSTSVTPEMAQYIRATREVVGDLAAKLREVGQPVEKYSTVFAEDTARQAAWKTFEARGDCEVTSSMPNNMELNTKGANKGAGLLALGRVLGIPRQGIMAVGDSSNDIEMLRAAGVGVAMGNASEEAKAAADLVTASCEEDGVAAIIEKVLAEKTGGQMQA